MNINLFLTILIALILIFCIILYIGLRIFLSVEKEKGIVKYEFKISLLKIPIFKRSETKEIIETAKDEDEARTESETSDKDSKESKKEESESKDKNSKKDDEKGLKEKYNEIKPILKELKKSKKELKSFLKNILKAIDIKRIEGNLKIGLSDHAITIKIASWIWSIGAIVNSKKSRSFTVEPIFTEILLDFEGKLELKINLLLLLFYSLVLLCHRNIIELIKEIYNHNKSKKEKEEKEEKEEKKVKEEVKK